MLRCGCRWRCFPGSSIGATRGDQRRATFLRNHAGTILARDFFVAVTANFRLLYVFVIIEHGSRQLLRVAVTAHPTAAWTLQQLREVVGFDHASPAHGTRSRRAGSSIDGRPACDTTNPPSGRRALRRTRQIGAGWLATRISTGDRVGVIG